VTAGIHRLSDRQVKAHKERGRLSDDGGVYLQISKWGTKSWEFRFTLHGRTRNMGLGQYDVVSLKKAREEAEMLRRIVREGIDPIKVRKAAKLKAQAEAATAILFKDAIDSALPGRRASSAARGMVQVGAGAWTPTLCRSKGI